MVKLTAACGGVGPGPGSGTAGGAACLVPELGPGCGGPVPGWVGPVDGSGLNCW